MSNYPLELSSLGGMDFDFDFTFDVPFDGTPDMLGPGMDLPSIDDFLQSADPMNAPSSTDLNPPNGDTGMYISPALLEQPLSGQTMQYPDPEKQDLTSTWTPTNLNTGVPPTSFNTGVPSTMPAGPSVWVPIPPPSSPHPAQYREPSRWIPCNPTPSAVPFRHPYPVTASYSSPITSRKRKAVSPLVDADSHCVGSNTNRSGLITGPPSAETAKARYEYNQKRKQRQSYRVPNGLIKKMQAESAGLQAKKGRPYEVEQTSEVRKRNARRRALYQRQKADSGRRSLKRANYNRDNTRHKRMIVEESDSSAEDCESEYQSHHKRQKRMAVHESRNSANDSDSESKTSSASGSDFEP